MADETEVKEVVSVGAPQRVVFNTPQPALKEEETITEENPAEESSTGDIENEQEKPEEEIPVKLSELSKEQIAELFKKNFPTEEEQTEAEKVAEAKAYERRLLEAYMELEGATIENFTAMKQVLAMDVADLSTKAALKEYMDAGFTKEESEQLIAERYYQMNLEELEIGDDESDEDFEKRKALVAKKVAVGKARLENKGNQVKESAAITLNNLKEKLSQKDSEAKKEKETIAKIEELSKTLPKKYDVELGKLNDQPLGSVQIDVTDTDRKVILDQISDPVKRKQLILNEDGSVDVEKLANILLENTAYQKAAREGLLEGQTRAAKEIDKVFPHRSPQAVGLGTSFTKPNNEKGKVVSAGKPQRVNANQR